MIVVDVGNTNTVIGFYINNKLIKINRINTKDILLKKNLHTLFYRKIISEIKYEDRICIISSVSSSEKTIISFFKSLDFKILNINISNIPKKIKFNYKSNQLGADRIANTFAAIHKYGNNSLVIDFGTATTFDVIRNKIYEGGAITPGINISHDALVKNASQLNKISIKPTNIIIGKDTRKSMEGGFYWSYVNLINGNINKIILEKKFRPKIILTGGLANIFKKEIKYLTYYEPNLTLEGLYLIGLATYA